jgi:TPR repeat protein
MWHFIPHDIEQSMLAAIRAFGPDVVAADHDDQPPLDQVSMGRRLVRLAFGADKQPGDLPEVLAALIADPDGSDAKDELVQRAFAAFNADPAKVKLADAMLGELYRQRADTGDARELMNLAEFLGPTDPQGAISAYRRAIDAGYPHAMINLALFLEREVGDTDAALAVHRHGELAGRVQPQEREAHRHRGSRHWPARAAEHTDLPDGSAYRLLEGRAERDSPHPQVFPMAPRVVTTGDERHVHKGRR